MKLSCAVPSGGAIFPAGAERPAWVAKAARLLACGVAGLALVASTGTARAATPEPAAHGASAGATDFSRAERLLLMSPQFARVTPPARLGYRFRQSGSLEPGFEDRVTLNLKRQPDGSCCQAQGEFLSGKRRVPMPDIEQAQGNPVTMYFLERDIRDMNQRTKGSVSYFRKRIRMALYQGATVRDVTVSYRGRAVPAQEIAIQPYLDDPNRAKFERFVRKQYVFVLSEAVPGSVVSIRSTVPGEGGVLLDEELLVDGAEAPQLTALR